MNLKEFFEQHPDVGIAFSGGVDSAFLLYAALQYARHVKAYYVKSQFQPQFELDDAIKLAKQLGADMTIIDVDILSNETVRNNPQNRCYFCKREIFGSIITKASEDGIKTLLDGTNASDDAGDRPGMKALSELQVLSPLRMCGLTKDDVRVLSREAGLFTWDKPAYACLATRIRSGEMITREKLEITEKAEGYLFSLDFSDLRVRMMGNSAKVQIKKEQFGLLEENKSEILMELGKYYTEVVIDQEGR